MDSRPNDLRPQPGSPLKGVLLVVIVSLSWGLGWTAMKLVLNEVRPWTFRSICLLLGGIPVIIGALLLEPDPAIASVSGNALLALAFMVLVAIIFCQWAFFRVVQIFPANVAALSTMSIPVIGVFSGALILGEPVTWNELAALFLVLASLGLTAYPQRKT